MVCPDCGAANESGTAVCAHCGAALAAPGAPADITPIIVPTDDLTPAAPEEPDAAGGPGDTDPSPEQAPTEPGSRPAPVETDDLPAEPAGDPAESSPAPEADAIPVQRTPFDASVLHPLPDGALLGDGYVVRGLLQHAPQRNLYHAVARARQRCPTCAALAPAGAAICARCTGALDGAAPRPAYLLTEAFAPADLLADPALLDLALQHPHLAPLVELFTYTPYPPPRHYLVAEAPDGVPLDQLTLPQSAERVLDWGLQLADALRYLHERGVSSPAGAANIRIDGDTALLANLQHARLAAPAPDTRAQEFAADVEQLATTLYETLTGQYAGAAGAGPLLPDSLPAEVEVAFARALRPTPADPPLTAASWRESLVAACAALGRAAPSLRVRSGRLSDVGRMRALNEDSLSVVECQIVQESVSAGLGVYVVADGMGGHAGGEVASMLAIAAVTAALLQRFVAPQYDLAGAEPTSAQISAWLEEAVQRANACIHEERQVRGSDMGTTLVVAVVAGEHAYIANVGDSRAYLLDPSGSGPPVLRQVTVDHSLVQRLVSAGQITDAQARVHPMRNMIYKSLGERSQVEVDIFTERVRPGSRLLLCSDGLSGPVPDTDLGALLAAETDPQVACTRLVAAANAGGGPDNITAVAVYVENG